jgi:hypothetical protein
MLLEFQLRQIKQLHLFVDSLDQCSEIIPTDVLNGYRLCWPFGIGKGFSQILEALLDIH